MKLRRASWLLTTVGMLVSLILSACGGAPAAPTTGTEPSAPAASAAAASPATDNQPASAAPEASAAASPAASSAANMPPTLIKMPEQIAGGRPVNITVIGKPPESQPEALAGWTAQVERFQELYPNVTVTGSDYTYSPDTFATLVAGKQVPTLFEVYLSDPSKIIDQGVAADLSTIFNEQKLGDVFNPNILSITSKDGKVYGIPKFAYAMGLGYNIGLLKEAGFDGPPSTWEELATMAQKLTNRDNARAGFSFISDGSNATGWQFTTMAYTWGAKQSSIVQAKDGKYEAGFASGAPVDALNFVKELRWKYDVLPRENLDWAKNGETFATGRSALALIASDQFSWIRTTFPDVDMSQLALAPLPTGPDGKSVSLVGGNIAMISSAATDDEKEAATYFRLWTQFDATEIQRGYDVSKQDPTVVVGTPFLPLYVGEYQDKSMNVQKQYANLPVQNYQLFMDAVTGGKIGLEPEPATAGQEYYGAIGAVVNSILTDESVDPAAAAKQASDTFQVNVLDRLSAQ